MTLNLKKLCVGVETLEQLADFTKHRRDAWRESKAEKKGEGIKEEPFYDLMTRNMPQRSGEILAGGSLYWVINRKICVRQPILDLVPTKKESGQSACLIRLQLKLFPVVSVQHRPFQGWRYLESKDSPPDLVDKEAHSLGLPPHIQEELYELGLL